MLAFSHEVRIPRDPASGLPTGTRKHEAIGITQEFDKSSPLLCQALANGREVDEVAIDFCRHAPIDLEEHCCTITMENARIVSVRPWMPNTLDPATESCRHMEDVSFTCQRIRCRWQEDQTEVQDTWTSGVPAP